MSERLPTIPGATATGLILPLGLSIDTWQEVGRALGEIATAHQWWVGDWWNYGERAYGEMASQASDLGIKPDTLSDWAAVAERVEIRLRNRNLSWSHHKAVSHLSGEDQQRWLDEAELDQLDVRELRRRIATRELSHVDPPVGKYRCIVIDPPWPMDKIEREVRPNQGPVLDYPTMSVEAIADLPIADLAASPGAHVYLWTTHRFMPDALRLFESWGVTYQCVMTWVKNVGITPFSWMYDTEHVLFGRIGSLPLERLGLRLSFEASAVGHSVKPDVFYDRVIEASPEPRIDLFARRPRVGFDVWGNEVAS